MNNDRVRIYDLSKELNLENKDLLAICSQLNIAVKSHSSTINETDAERIRAAAEKQVALTASRKKSSATSPLTHSQMAAKAQPKNSPSHKQQILEIRKPRTLDRTNPSISEEQTSGRSSQSSAVPPVAPQPYSPPIAPTRPTAPAQPAARKNSPETESNSQTEQLLDTPVENLASQEAHLFESPKRPVDPAPVASQLQQPKPEEANQTVHESVETTTETADEKSNSQTPVASTSRQATPRPQPVVDLQRPKVARLNELETPAAVTQPQPNVATTEPKVAAEKPARPEVAPAAKAASPQQQLAKPPVKPAPPVAPTPQPNQSEQPARKRDKVNRPSEITKETTTEKPVRRTPVASKAEQETSRAQPVIEIRRPKVVRPSESRTPAVALLPKPNLATAEPKAVETDSIDLLDSPEELLERPKLPSPIRAGKKRQVEEIDDGQEAKAKVGKVGSKVKRVKSINLDDDEEYLEDAEQDLDTSLFVSPAFVRPAKQKASAVKAPAILASIPVAPRGKKSTSSRDHHRHQELEAQRERPEQVVVTGSMTVQELADALGVQDTEIVKILFFKGMAVNITQSLDIPTIKLVGEQLEVKIETAEPEAEARKITEMLDVGDLENLQHRPPVVTIMGHVDHGKTTLLDSIRHTKVAQGEAGGITQHIGAYHVDVEHDGKVQQVVFLDTPGHEAFTAMRARGARVTDIAILVVAADDGVRPQTVEAISHAKAAEVPLVVAINKIDKPEAQPERVMQELTEYGLVAEEWGGETIMVPVSAIKGENLDTLLEMILLVAEVEDLQANPNRSAKGTVIEANLDKTRGPVATLLVQNGTLHVGDVLVAGSALGKVRAMIDDTGARVQVASPSFAVEVLGLSDVPAAGDEFEVFHNEKEARAIASARADKQRQSRLMQGRVNLATLSAQAQEGELKELNLILKADVQGSVEAIVGALRQLPQNEVQLRMLLAAPGEITETDIDLASASNAVIVGFNTTLASGARQAADEAGVDVREYNIIYKLLEDIEGAMEGLLEPELVEEALGQVEVRAVFPVGRGQVAGCYVQSGKVVRNCKLRVRRGSKVVYEGTIDSLKRMKDDAKEVNAGYECGIGIDKFNDWAESDIIETYQMVTKRRTLSAAR